MYAYCLNNPVNLVDYSGTDANWWAIAGAAIGAAFAVALVVAMAPTVVCTVAAGLMYYGVSATAAEAIAVIGVTAVGINEALVGADTGYAMVSGTSPMATYAFRGNAGAYEDWRILSATAMFGMGNMYQAGQQMGTCFIAGTLIDTEDGLRPIEEIKAGDYVWAWNEETGEVSLKPVLETYIRECDELVHLSFGEEEIICTPNHPFYVPVKGWTDAVHLRAGDILVTVNGEYVVLELVQHELLEAPITVYNFQVDDYHTYYVGNSSVLVHNADCGYSASYNFNGSKNENYMRGRGWDQGKISAAMNNGAMGTSVNKATGNPCTVYCYPGTSFYVVIDDVTHSVVQFSMFGDTAWKPDSTIIWGG